MVVMFSVFFSLRRLRKYVFGERDGPGYVARTGQSWTWCLFHQSSQAMKYVGEGRN